MRVCEITAPLAPLPPIDPDTLVGVTVHDNAVPLTLLGLEMVRFVDAPEQIAVPGVMLTVGTGFT